MRCPSCGVDNPEGASFCGECATPLEIRIACPSCGAENPGAQKFCNSCGHSLHEEPRVGRTVVVDRPRAGPPEALTNDPRSYTPDHLAEKILGARTELEGERKQVTVLFADVMGSMDLAERTDPEAWRRIMDGFFATLAHGVHRFEGTVDKFTGDGIMALFGAPIAHEDHAQRACFAALHLADELAEYATELRRTQGLNFSVRIGLNSGEVVVGAIGEDLSLEYTAIGHTVGLAQRMESLAEPGKAYLAPETAKLVAGYLNLRDLGEFEVKGVSEPIRIHELVGAGVARSRLDISRARGFTRFVGREEEVQTLEAALEAAQAGNGSVVGVVGEAGVGKSRLCHEFAERCRRRGIPVYEAQGQAHAKAIPFLPVLQMMRGYFGVSEHDSDRQAREKIAGRLLLLDEAFAEDLPLIFDFLAVPDPERPAPRMDPEARQRALLAGVKRLVHASSQVEPGVNLLEDLHWIDPGSETFLAQLVEAVPGTRNVTVVNFRPEYSAEWMRKSYYRQISLLPLGPQAIEALLRDLIGADSSLDGLPDLIRERTAGNPFFMEELVRALVEAGNLAGERGAYRLLRPVDGSTVPPTVNAVLAARIDRLGEREKDALQNAAVIGTEFTQPVLARAAQLSGDDLEATVRSLIASEFLYEQELYPEAVYAFKHPLTREVAYGTQLGERRAAVHRRVAEALQELYADRLDERAALLAQHWESAGEELEAARWSARAAAWAGINDISEAIRNWRKVGELVQSLPESPETIGLALASRVWRLNHGWRLGISEQEAAALYEGGRELAERSGDSVNLLLLQTMYATVRGLGGHVEEYVELTREAMGLADSIGAPAMRMAVMPNGIYSHMVRGHLDEALRLADEAMELGRDDPTLAAGMGLASPYAFCVMMRGVVLNAMGRLDEAEAEHERALRVAREQGDLETQGWTHANHAFLARNTGRTDIALSHATQGYEIAERIGDSFSRGWALTNVGYAHLLREEWQEAIEAVEVSLERSREARTGLEGEPWRLAILAEALIGAGDGRSARATAEEAVALTLERGSEWILPYCYRVLAEALLASDGPGAGSDAGAALDNAESAAERTGARSELPFIERTRSKLIPV